MYLHLTYDYNEKFQCNTVTSFHFCHTKKVPLQENELLINIKDVPKLFYNEWREFEVIDGQLKWSTKLVSHYFLTTLKK